MYWLRTLAFLVFVPGTVLFYVPYVIASSAGTTVHLGPVRFLGIVALLLGTSILLWCAWDFTFKGRGTPAPVDPPKELVTEGLYLYVRNPMYVGAALILLGHFLWSQAVAVFFYGCAVLICFHLFVVYYEEPALTRKFGESYRKYCARVPRWVPRWPRR